MSARIVASGQGSRCQRTEWNEVVLLFQIGARCHVANCLTDVRNLNPEKTVFETSQDSDFRSNDHSRRQFLRRLGMSFAGLGLASMSSPVLGLTEVANAAAEASAPLLIEPGLIDASMENLMRALKFEMLQRGEEISERSLKAQGFSDGFVKHFLTLEVPPDFACVT